MFYTFSLSFISTLKDERSPEESCKDDDLCKIHEVTPEMCNIVNFNKLDYNELCPKTCQNCNRQGKGDFLLIILS